MSGILKYEEIVQEVVRVNQDQAGSFLGPHVYYGETVTQTKRRQIEAYINDVDGGDSQTQLPSPMQTQGVIFAPYPLTRQNLIQFCKSQNISPPMDVAAPSLTTYGSLVNAAQSPRNSRTTKALGPNDPRFDIQLQRLGVHLTSVIPHNVRSTIDRLGASGFHSLSAAQAHDLAKIAALVRNESTFTHLLLPAMFGVHDGMLNHDVRIVFNGQWSSNPLAEPTRLKLTAPKPDITVGMSRWSFPFDDAIESQETTACPVVCCPELIFPCFTVEAKGFGRAEVSRRQNRHNGAIMLRNLVRLHSLAGSDSNTENLIVFSAVATNEVVELFLHYIDGASYYSAIVGKWSIQEANEWDKMIPYLRNAMDVSITVNKEHIHSSLEAITRSVVPSFST